MPELAFFAHDHSTDLTVSTQQVASKYKPFDLVDWRPDGWLWGKEELTNPWFRIVAWPDAVANDLDTLLTPQPASGGTKAAPQFLWQRRAFFLNLDQTNLTLSATAPSFQAWWADDKRAAPVFALAKGPLTVVALKVQRLPIANPAFIGISPNLIG